MKLNPKWIVAALAAVVLSAAAGWYYYESQKVCCGFPDEPEPMPPLIDRKPMGLMTSLPLYWPANAEFTEIAQGNVEIPWQRRILEMEYELVPLDTLSLIAGLDTNAPETDPLADLDRLAVIQPRGLSPADNVALDNWVRAGGRLLIVLDPMLTGHYEFPIGDPRRPSDVALVPPVIARWGLEIVQDDTISAEPRLVSIDRRSITVEVFGQIRPIDNADPGCNFTSGGEAAWCSVGNGRVTVLADAAIFEQVDFAGPNGESIRHIVRLAFD